MPAKNEKKLNQIKKTSPALYQKMICRFYPALVENFQTVVIFPAYLFRKKKHVAVSIHLSESTDRLFFIFLHWENLFPSA